MLTDAIYARTDILESAMQASQKRNEVTLNNIANADTPGFKKKTVDFEESLNKAVKSATSLDNLDLSGVVPQVREMHSGFNYRLDENNVDIETEMVELYQNAVRYDTMTSGIISIFKRLNAAVQVR